MIKIQDKTNSVAPGGDYSSFGRMKDNTGSNDGSPLDTALHNDAFMFIEKIMAESSVTPNGLADNDANGYQIYEAFRKLTKPYKVYTAIINQNGGSNPVVTVMGENEIGNIVWTRGSTGIYDGDLLGAFVGDRWFTIALPSNSSRLSRGTISDNQISIFTTDLSGTFVDSALIDVPLEIRVYD